MGGGEEAQLNFGKMFGGEGYGVGPFEYAPKTTVAAGAVAGYGAYRGSRAIMDRYKKGGFGTGVTSEGGKKDPGKGKTPSQKTKGPGKGKGVFDKILF